MKIDSTPVRVARVWVDELNHKLEPKLASKSDFYSEGLLHPYGMNPPPRDEVKQDCRQLEEILENTPHDHLAEVSPGLKQISLEAAHRGSQVKLAGFISLLATGGGLCAASKLGALSPTAAIIGGALGAVAMGTCLAVGSRYDDKAQLASHQAKLVDAWDCAIQDGNPVRAPIRPEQFASGDYGIMVEQLAMGLRKPVAPLPPPGLLLGGLSPN